jgi:cytochrome c oxidase subunit IV
VAAERSLHVLPVRTYVLVFLALMVLTAITVAVAFFNLGALNNVVALTIAVVKAVLVILIFMHVKYATRLTWLVVVGAFFWLAILLFITLGDYLTRGFLQAGT